MVLAVLAGPLALARRTPARAGVLVFLIILLTAITQIGGLVLWFCVPAGVQLNRRLGDRGPALRTSACLGLFAAAYLGASFATVPLAGAFGRAPLDCGLTGAATYGPRTILTCLLNRHYATLPARRALQKVSVELSADFKGSGVAYLDAGFPFFDWFPMFPHISHGDGRKIDLALVHMDYAATPSPIGYWGFVQPRPGDPQPCNGREGWLRWDMAWLRPLLPEIELDEDATAELLWRLVASPSVRRILIEPHLEVWLRLDHPKLRFQGCRAARHDDHIHVEFDAN
ncbi:MAG: hypothetical protein ABFS30_13285 [Pseudomonadota bacterium]